MTDLLPQELRVIAAVADARGFSAAARTLGMTQSAVSHSVRASERKIGAVLFERGRLGAAPTPAGDVAAGHARRVLRLLDVLGAEARGAAAGSGGAETMSGPLRIAAFRSAALYLLPPALERLTARHPGIEPVVRMVREVGRGTAGEVLDGRADLRAVPQSLAGARRQLRHLAALSERPNTSSMRTSLRLAMHRI